MPLNLTHTNAALRVCIDCVEDGRVSGRVFSQRLTAPMVFSDIGNLLLRLEAVLDTQNFPQAFQRARSFSKKQQGAGIPAAGDVDEGMSPESVEAATGAVSTFILYVLSRRNTTWQGKINWLDGGIAQEFSSVLELIKLTDQHIFGEY